MNADVREIAERAIREIREELYREPDGGYDCDIIMTLDLYHALQAVPDNWIYYHGFNSSPMITMFGRPVVTVNRPGFSYWISRERRISANPAV